MAEDQGEKTEEASDTRREDFRKRGQVAMTRELSTALFFLISAGLLYMASRFFLVNIFDMFNRSMGIGFALLTLATIAGATWAYIESGTRWIGDAKIAISFLTWGLCLVMVFLRTSAGWRGRKAAIMSLAVLGSSALTWIAHVGLRPALMR